MKTIITVAHVAAFFAILALLGMYDQPECNKPIIECTTDLDCELKNPEIDIKC